MKAGKAYITSLGTTGLLVASSVMLLVVVGALVAFDGWPSSDAHSAPPTVALGEGDTERVVARRRIERARVVFERRDRGAAAPRGDRRRGGRERRDAAPGGEEDRVISELPAPDTRPGGATGAATSVRSAPAPGGDGSTPAPSSGGMVGQVGETVSHVSPQAGGAIDQTGDAVGGTVDEIVIPTSPGQLLSP